MKKIFSTWEKLGCYFYPAFKFYHQLYRDVVKQEIDLAGITSEDQVLNIGCGAIPFTAIHIVQMTGARVLGLDCDAEAIEKARYCLKKYRLDENIQLQVGDGRKAIPGDFTAAFVALQVQEKERVLKHLMATASPGSPLVFRCPIPSYVEEYGDFAKGRSPDGTVEQAMKTFRRSCLFIVPEKPNGAR